MKKSATKTALASGVIFLAMVLFASDAFSWGSASHAYINDQLLQKSGQHHNEVYGGVAPDLFNYRFDLPFLQDLYALTHDEFTKVWNSAKTKQEKAIAYSFASHNDLWGADSTAHHSGRTVGTSEGYIFFKAYQLKSILESVPEYAALQLPDPLSLEISHELVESGVDILVKRTEPQIGGKLAHAAMHQSPAFSSLLTKAYARDFSTLADISRQEASRLIRSAEKKFRKSMALYGQALLLDEPTAIQLIAEQMADIANEFLSAYGITLPEGADFTPLIQFAIEQSITLCGEDFAGEIAATITYVDQQLMTRGITY